MTITRIVARLRFRRRLLCAPAQVSAKSFSRGTRTSVCTVRKQFFQSPIADRVQNSGEQVKDGDSLWIQSVSSHPLISTTNFFDGYHVPADGIQDERDRLQYAYLFTTHRFSVHAGKILCRSVITTSIIFIRFRKSVSPPVFQSAILGLPIGGRVNSFRNSAPNHLRWNCPLCHCWYGGSDAAGTSRRVSARRMRSS